MSEHTEDISAIFPGEVMTLRGEQVLVRPFYFGELPVVVKMVKPILSAAGISQMIRVVPTAGKKFGFKLDIPVNLLEILTEALCDGSEPAVALLAFAIKKDRDWFNTLESDEGFDLLATWFKVNKDFFSRRVLPKIPGLMEQMKKQAQEKESSSDGLTSSQS